MHVDAILLEIAISSVSSHLSFIFYFMNLIFIPFQAHCYFLLNIYFDHMCKTKIVHIWMPLEHWYLCKYLAVRIRPENITTTQSWGALYCLASVRSIYLLASNGPNARIRLRGVPSVHLVVASPSKELWEELYGSLHAENLSIYRQMRLLKLVDIRMDISSSHV